MYKDFNKLTTEEKENLLDIYYQTIVDIINISIDYDGYRKADDLMALIDELRGIAVSGLKGERQQYIKMGGKVVTYCMGKEVEVPESLWSADVLDWKYGWKL